MAFELLLQHDRFPCRSHFLLYFFVIFSTYLFVGILNPDHMQPNVIDLRDAINWVAMYCFMLNFTKYLSRVTSSIYCWPMVSLLTYKA